VEPTRELHGTLSDLLDRVLDKGLVVSADLIITLSGIPLIAVNLKATMAGMETMLEHGLMRDWDESIRSHEQETRQSKAALVARN